MPDAPATSEPAVQGAQASPPPNQQYQHGRLIRDVRSAAACDPAALLRTVQMAYGRTRFSTETMTVLARRCRPGTACSPTWMRTCCPGSATRSAPTASATTAIEVGCGVHLQAIVARAGAEGRARRPDEPPRPL
ncbi:hypothetical protein [Couchioplanes caeruleus]|uniref:hypothetical protein n=1 Tax=Couchioplanes caeruleus TaxID=56438 RepID=UPI001160628D|nr:hypothetical protein [Couchioplanes caeruleus]